MNDTPDGYIARLKEGSYEVFSDLYAHYSNRLYGFAMAQTKNNALAEDIVQEAFLKLWNTRQQLDCYGNVHALLFTIARNLIIDGFRKRIAQIDFEEYQQACHKMSSIPTPEEQVNYHEVVEQVEQTKRHLSKRACQIYEMSREKNMTIQEIADSLNLSSQTVKNYLTSTLKVFRRELKQR